MAKQSKRKKLRDKIDGLFAQVIKERDGNICQHCGRKVKGQNAHCAHVYSRNNLFMRWDLLNALCLDFHCHIQFWHSGEGIKWFAEAFPARYEYLNAPMIDEFGKSKSRRHITVKMNDAELKTIYENLKCKLKELKSE